MMLASLYCVDHAMGEALVLAPFVHDGRTCCGHHLGLAEPTLGSTAPDGGTFLCAWCRQAPHRAYFLVDHEPLCIRHAADAVFPDDDMGAHDMAHAVYRRLNAAGVEDAY